MAGYNNPRLVDIENEVLRDRLASIKAAAGDLADAVERYVTPKKGQPYCGRNEVLRIKETLKTLLK